MDAITRNLPPTESLTERQLRGADCVFCGRDLFLGDVRNLGEQTREVFGSVVAWFPRADPGCLTGGAS